MKIHPLAEMIPPMTPEEYEQLRDSIKENGQLNPIILFQNSILDGRHRMMACRELQITPKFEHFHENGVSAVEFVASQNIHRRNLTISQLACCASFLYEQMKVPTGSREGIGRHIKGSPGAIHYRNDSRRTDYKVAKIFGIGQKSVSRASTLRKRDLKLFQEVFSGKIKLNTAYNKAVPNLNIYNKMVMPKEELPKDFKVPQVFDSLDVIMVFHKQLLALGFHATLHASTQGWACRYVKGATFKIACFTPIDYAPDFRSSIVRGGRQALGLK